MVKKLEYYYDLQQIKAEVASALKAIDISKLTVKQLLLTCPTETSNHDFYGTGKIYDKTQKKYLIPQESFCEFNPRFRDTYLESIWKDFPFPVGRVRLMMLTQKHAYSLHCDAEPRFHIAVDTNPDCYLIYKDRPEWFHVPADGHLYRVETNYFHSAMNCSEELRTHIVFDGLEAYPS